MFLKRTVPTAGLLVIPRSGHTITSEEPAAFNAALAELFAAAEAGRWLAHKTRRIEASVVGWVSPRRNPPLPSAIGELPLRLILPYGDIEDFNPS